MNSTIRTVNIDTKIETTIEKAFSMMSGLPEERFHFLNNLNETLRSIKWTDDDKKALLDEYIQLPIHIALERAVVKENWKSFSYIYNKERKLLIKHMINTHPCWYYKARIHFPQLNTYLESKGIKLNINCKKDCDCDE